MNPDERWESEDRMFFGMSSLNLSRAFNRAFDMDTTSYNNLDTNYAANQGMYGVTIDYFWIAKRDCTGSGDMFEVDSLTCAGGSSCAANLDTDPPYNFCTASCYYTCETCDGSLPQNCSTCNSTNHRVMAGS